MRESHCFGHTGKKKLVFAERWDAWAYLKEHNHHGMRPYKCPDCKKWHLTQVR